MDRRTFLATSTAGLALASAGCSGLLGSTVTLKGPETETQDDGREKYHSYRHDGERVVTVGFDQRTVPETLSDRFGFRITASHSDDTTIDSFQFDLRAPRTSIDPPAEFYLGAPAGGLWPDITLEEIDDGFTRIALEDTGELGDGTLGLDTIVDPGSVPAESIAVRVEMTLSSSGFTGRTYRISPQTEFAPVRP